MEALYIEEKPRDHCGIFALHNYQGLDTAAHVTYLGLLALQHRGQESAGMAYAGPTGIHCRKGMGLVSTVFPRHTLNKPDKGSVIGHVRYSTTGDSEGANAQPLSARSLQGESIAVAHNGNISNSEMLKEALLKKGHIFHATTDTETLLSYLFYYRQLGLAEAAAKTMSLLEGAYAVVAVGDKEMVAFRDPLGFRPLVMGRLEGSYVFASETCALSAVGATIIRDLRPGEIVSLRGEEDPVSTFPSPGSEEAFCIFEYVYFARPDSSFKGRNVHLTRKAIGAQMARGLAPDLDMVIPSPDSGVSAAMGLAEAAGLPLEWAIYRNPYRGRTFIEPSHQERQISARLKYNPVDGLVRGKRVAVVDDSLVRGTTAKILTSMLREKGAAAVHFYIAAPPYLYPCYFGVDIPLATELAACGLEDLSRLAGEVGADSITFASLEDLFTGVGDTNSGFCDACFTGNYPHVRSGK